MKYSRILLIVPVVLILAWTCFLFLGRAANGGSVSFYYKNCRQVNLYDGQETVGDGDNKLVARITKSGQMEKLKIGHKYIVKYAASDGYASGRLEFQAEKTKKLIIDPYYSQSKLAALPTSEVNAINFKFSQSIEAD
jgi:hypothetical protein